MNCETERAQLNFGEQDPVNSAAEKKRGGGATDVEFETKVGREVTSQNKNIQPILNIIKVNNLACKSLNVLGLASLSVASSREVVLVFVLWLHQLGAVDAAYVHLVGPHHDTVMRPRGEVTTTAHGAVMPTFGRAQLNT